MRMISSILAALSTCLTPAEATRAALADVQSLDPQWRGQMRYVVCEGQEQETAVRYLVNAVSRSRRIVQPERLTATRSGALLRIDLATLADQKDPRSYHELHAAWERLAADDPYFHVKTQVAVNRDAQRSATLATVTVNGGWVGLHNAAALRTATTSAGAVLRADYFVSRVAADDYYGWAGVPVKQADFLSGLGVDKAVVERLAADAAANLFKSNVTHKPRRVVRLPAPQGSIWLTLDVDGESPDRDPIRSPVDVIVPAGVSAEKRSAGALRLTATRQGSAGAADNRSIPPGNQRFNFQASEIFFTRANGFWGTALYDSSGKRQASVPDRIAKDSEAQDGIVQPLISCIRCHEPHGAGGLQSFTDDQHPLISGEAAILKSYLPEVAQCIGELYDPARLDKAQRRDREDYAAAVEAACGCTTKAASAALSETFARFVYDDVTRDIAAAECGVASAEFIDRTTASNDPVTLALRAGKRVTRKSYEASFQDIMLRVTQ